MEQVLDIPTELLEAIELAKAQRKAREKLEALDRKLAFSKSLSNSEFDEAFKLASVLSKKNTLLQS